MRRHTDIVRRLAFCRAPVGAAMLWAAACLAQPMPATVEAPRQNFFGDPFLRLTAGIADCTAPEGPSITEAERRAQAHDRVERGTSCFQSGQCRLPNSYLYDREIIPRVQKAVDADGRFAATTSVWALGQRRWVWLQGCVRTPDESRALEQMVHGLDDVEGVVNELKVTPAR